MKKVFSTRYFRYVLRTQSIPFIIFTVACLLVTLLSSNIRVNMGTVDIVTVSSINSLLSVIPQLAILFTASAFAAYMKRCDSDFFESLPYTRRQIMISTVSAMSLLSLATIILSCVGCSVIALGYLKDNVFLLGDSIMEMLEAWTLTCLSISMTAVAISLTGKLGNAILAGLIIMTVPDVLIETFCNMAEINPLLVGSMNPDILGLLPAGVGIIVEFIVAMAFLVLALFLFDRRKSEIATKFYANSVVGHILRVGIALPTSLMVVDLIFSIGEDTFAISIIGIVVSLIITLIIYFGYELIGVKGKRALVSALKGLPILIGINVLVAATAFATGSMMASVVPTESTIDYVSLVAPDGDELLYFYDDSLYAHVEREAGDIKLTEPEAKKIIAKAFDENLEAYREGKYDDKYIYGRYGDEAYEQITVKIGLGFGTITRQLYITPEEKMELTMLLAEREEYRQLWLDLPENPYAVIHSNNLAFTVIERDDAALVYDSLVKEVSAMSFEEWYGLNSEYAEHSLTVVVKDGGDAYRITVPVTTPIAKEILAEKLNANAAENYAELTDLIDRAARGEDAPFEISMGVTLGVDYYYGWFMVDDSDEGKSTAEFIKNVLAPTYPDLTGDYADVSFDTTTGFFEYEYYEFSLSDKYSLEEIKMFFAENESGY